MNKIDNEFYLRYEDTKAELSYYSKLLKDKTIYLPCDDYKKSNFYTYFKDNFKKLGLKKLIATNYKSFDLLTFGNYKKPKKATYDGNLEELEYLKGDGDFLSSECTEILNECDLVITNPPFDLEIEFLNWILASKKDYLFVGKLSSSVKPEFFDEIFNERMFFGVNRIQSFRFEGRDIDKFDCLWYTNLNHGIKKDFINSDRFFLDNNFSERQYRHFFAFDCPTIKDIPEGVHDFMGVPITFFPILNREEFDLLGTTGYNFPEKLTVIDTCDVVFSRLIIRYNKNFLKNRK